MKSGVLVSQSSGLDCHALSRPSLSSSARTSACGPSQPRPSLRPALPSWLVALSASRRVNKTVHRQNPSLLQPTEPDLAGPLGRAAASRVCPAAVQATPHPVQPSWCSSNRCSPSMLRDAVPRGGRKHGHAERHWRTHTSKYTASWLLTHRPMHRDYRPRNRQNRARSRR